MNGGKDVKFGDDKRRVSIIPSNEQSLYNIANGEILTDEFGTPLITEVDEYYVPDASIDRSTSITFSSEPYDTYTRVDHSRIAALTGTYGVDLDAYVSTTVLTVGSGSVSFGETVSLQSGGTVTVDDYPYVIVKTVEDIGVDYNKIYFEENISSYNIQVFDKISGGGIPDDTFISKSNSAKLVLSKETTISGSPYTAEVGIDRSTSNLRRSDNVWKIAEQFKETSQVSSSLLGVPRAETQLSLFSNVSSYGLDPDEFEFYTYNAGTSFGSWDNRANNLYGNRYLATRTEEIQESGIKIQAFPPPYSYPFGPKFVNVGLYDETLFNQYISFIQLGNDLYEYYDTGDGSSLGYPADWKDRFLDPSKVYVKTGDVVYSVGISESFGLVDTWTDTWRDIKDSLLTDPVTGLTFNFSTVDSILDGSFDSTNTRPGYNANFQRYAFLQSRRVFRYQSGRISGFTFGLRSSSEPVSGLTLEWGISNPTDQYVFQINAGQLKIIRRSTIPLELSALRRSNLENADQIRKQSGDPFDGTEYWTIEIPRDKFNGDPLNGNGPSGYLIQPEKVTMYKIEFGWYGAIGARFYAYIPAGPGEARWVVIHTLVIENSLGSPCLQDSYFRLKYSLNIENTSDVRTPQFLYKYGASYYIDGGDEGTTQIYSKSSPLKATNPVDYRSIFGIVPKNYILNSVGTEIQNKKLIIPSRLSVTSDSLTEIKVITCKGCPGFGHVYTPGLASTSVGRTVEFEFVGPNDIAAINDTYFYESDIGAKLISPTIYNAYIVSVDGPVGAAGSFESALVKGYGPGLDGYPDYGDRPISGIETLDRITGLTTSIGNGPYPYGVRLSNYDHCAASNFKFTGSKIEIQFVNPNQKDSYSHWSDFLIGVTDVEPVTSDPNILEGFSTGAGTTTTLPLSSILFAEHTHSYAALNEEGVETSESWAPNNPPLRMGIDYRIPSLPSPSPGICSKVTIEISDPSQITEVFELNYHPEDGDPAVQDPEGRTFIQVEGSLPTVDYDGGQIAILSGETAQITGVTFIGDVFTYTSGNTFYSYIQISDTLGGSSGTPFTILIRPVKLTANGSPLKVKLYNYNPYPLYLVAKLKDNAAINNISVKETVGDFVRTISPKFYVFEAGGDLPSVEITNAGGNADISGAAPTNFDEVSRLSSALVDVQNEQRLRPGVERDILYVGANSTQEIDMSKIFGQDRRVVTPDNNNIEATFFVAKKIDAGDSGTIEAGITWKEQ